MKRIPRGGLVPSEPRADALIVEELRALRDRNARVAAELDTLTRYMSPGINEVALVRKDVIEKWVSVLRGRE